MRDLKRQQGVSIIALVAGVALAVVVVTIGVRLLPIYMEYFSVNSILKDVSSQGGASKRSITEIRKSAERHFSVNDINRVKLTDIVLDTKGGKPELVLKYEVRTKLIGNVDGVVVFDRRYELQP
ncbi:MAG: DUF4845 domain-containing protein [Chromatiales bacterium]|nr:DUF4845 domain-containing protein [Chromatiales bacterium]